MRRRTFRQRRRNQRILIGVLATAVAASAFAWGWAKSGYCRVLPAKGPAPTYAVTPAAMPRPTFERAVVTASPTSTPPPYPADMQALVLEGREGTYTIGWLSDTQHYAEEETGRALYLAMTAFLRDEQEALNLRYVVHTGDLVHHCDKAYEWGIAQEAFANLAGIPYGVLAGNHDWDPESEDMGGYARYFGEKAMRARPDSAYYQEAYQDNRGHYDLIDAGNTKYLFVYLSYSPDSGCIAWANEIFARYPARVGVLCVHDYFNTQMELSPAGKTLYRKIVAKNPNLYLVLCGHRYNIGYAPIQFDDDGDGRMDRTVYQLMCNYQAAGDQGGDGYMQFLQVDELQKEIRVYAYSPVTQDRRYYDTPGAQEEKYPVDPKNEEYILPIPWLLEN